MCRNLGIWVIWKETERGVCVVGEGRDRGCEEEREEAEREKMRPIQHISFHWDRENLSGSCGHGDGKSLQFGFENDVS